MAAERLGGHQGGLRELFLGVSALGPVDGDDPLDDRGCFGGKVDRLAGMPARMRATVWRSRAWSGRPNDQLILVPWAKADRSTIGQWPRWRRRCGGRWPRFDAGQLSCSAAYRNRLQGAVVTLETLVRGDQTSVTALPESTA